MRKIVLPLLLLLFSVAHVSAQKSTHNTALRELLEAECYDHVARRTRIIESENHTSQAAYWQAGYVWFDNGWIPSLATADSN